MKHCPLTIDPSALYLALRARAARDAALATARRLYIIPHGSCKRPAPYVQREHTARFANGETIHSNIAS